GVARAFGDDLKFVCARMHPPERAVELIFLAVIGAHAALVEHTVQSIKPAIRPPRQRIRQFMRVCAAEAVEDYFPARLFGVLLAQEEEVWRVESPDAAIPDCDAGRNVQSFGKCADFFCVSGGIGAFENFYSIATDTG